jgi:hypothetical protein
VHNSSSIYQTHLTHLPNSSHSSYGDLSVRTSPLPSDHHLPSTWLQGHISFNNLSYSSHKHQKLFESNGSSLLHFLNRTSLCHHISTKDFVLSTRQQPSTTTFRFHNQYSNPQFRASITKYPQNYPQFVKLIEIL